MPLLGMARKDKAAADKDKPLPAPDASADETGSENRTPQRRPGSSATEVLLSSKTREASAYYKRAQQAEQAYRYKKRAAGAKERRQSILVHFKQSAHHFTEGVKAVLSTIAAIPAVMKADRHDRKAKSEAKKRERDLEKRKKLDERLKKRQSNRNRLHCMGR
jgi:hypothetical protein